MGADVGNKLFNLIVDMGGKLCYTLDVENISRTDKEKKNMKKIRLFKTLSGWHAQFLNDAEVMKLFGTTILPTAYTIHADSESVRKAIQAKNPSCVVEVI